MSRKFIFIDESGDPGIRGGSEFFTINILVTGEIGLSEIEKEVSHYRFFTGHSRELKKYANPKNEKLNTIFKKLIFLNTISCFSFSAKKSSYEEVIRKKGGIYFRNFILKRSLEKLFTFAPFKSTFLENEYELIIDRYLHGEVDRENLRRLLFKSNAFFPLFLDIIQLDSRCSNPLQLLDVQSSFIANKNHEWSSWEDEMIIEHFFT